MITNVGLDEVLEFLEYGTGSRPTHIGIGTGTTTPNSSNTALVTEVFPNGALRTTPTISETNEVVTFDFVLKSSQGNGNTFAEEGLFTASTSGVMWTRLTHPDIVKDVSLIVPTFISFMVVSKTP